MCVLCEDDETERLMSRNVVSAMRTKLVRSGTEDSRWQLEFIHHRKGVVILLTPLNRRWSKAIGITRNILARRREGWTAWRKDCARSMLGGEFLLMTTCPANFHPSKHDGTNLQHLFCSLFSMRHQKRQSQSALSQLEEKTETEKGGERRSQLPSTLRC